LIIIHDENIDEKKKKGINLTGVDGLRRREI